MRSRIFLIVCLSLLAFSSCTPAQPPADVTDTPGTDSGATPSPSTPTNTPLPPPPDLPVAPSPVLVRFSFQDANNGWGVASDNGGFLLRTVDGGPTWLNATPPGLTGLGYSTVLDVLDVDTVWALVPNADFFTGVLYHTNDGGLTWTSSNVGFGGAGLQFMDASTGRVLAERGVGLGSEAVEFFQSSDGGINWNSVFNNDPTRPDSTDTLPFSGIKNGMAFLDANTGWVTGTRPMPGDVYLFVTRDGGGTWAQQSIPLPPGYEAYQYFPQSPLFFGMDGFMPLMVYTSEATILTFYTTHDGGTTWTGDPARATGILPPCTYAFADALHGWCWDGGTTLYATTDGAQTWTGTPTSLDLGGRLQQMEFVPSPTAGQFTGWALTNVDDSGHSQLYQTTDNGITWTTLIP